LTCYLLLPGFLFLISTPAAPHEVRVTEEPRSRVMDGMGDQGSAHRERERSLVLVSKLKRTEESSRVLYCAAVSRDGSKKASMPGDSFLRIWLRPSARANSTKIP
jgi:hypothetical protein